MPGLPWSGGVSSGSSVAYDAEREYVLNQLEAFASRARANDINMPMRTIAALLTEDERHALAEYYGSGLGLQPASASGPK